MLPPLRHRRKPLRLIRVPWPDDHPDWLALDRRLDNDHLARRIRCLVEQLDLTPLYDSFAGVGSPVHPPDLMLQLVLFEVWRKRLSPAQWLLDTQESVPAQWLLRGLLPSRGVLYRFRDHLPQELLDPLNAQVLQLAQQEGYTKAACAALDGTFHAAYGSRHKLVNADTLDRRCAQLDAVLASEPEPGPAPATPAQAGPPPAMVADAVGPGSNPAAADAASGPPPAPDAASDPAAAPGPAAGAEPAAAERPGWMGRSRRGRRRQRRRLEQARQLLRRRLAEHDKKQRRQRKAKRIPAERVVICPSEPGAALGKDKQKVFRPLYNTQILQDVDSPFVLGYGVWATATDAGLLPPLLERARALVGHRLDQLLTDGIYARLLDVRYCQQDGVQLYAPVAATQTPQVDAAPGPRQNPPQDPGKSPDGRGAPSTARDPSKDKDQGQGQDKPLGKELFTWLPQEQTYRCPQGHLLQLERRCPEERRDGEAVMVAQYRCAPAHCLACPLAARCTECPDKGRTVKRMDGQELLDEVAQRTQTAQGKALYRKRGQTVERRHADFKAHRGLERFRSYGLARARGLIALLVLAHNGLALLAARDAKKAKKTNKTESRTPP
jgi:transposase